MDLSISVALQRLSNFQAQLNLVNRKVDKAMGSATKSLSGFQDKWNGLVSNIPALGVALNALKNPIVGISIALAGITSAGAAAIKTTREFQKQVADTAAIAGIQRTDAAFTQLTEKARRLGRDTEFSATESAKAMEFLARAGFTVEQSIASADRTLALATVGNLQLAKAADISSNVMSQFGLSAETAAEQSANLGRVVDIIAKTTTSSNTNVTQFADAMNYLGATANALDIPLEEASAAVGILANSGLQGSLATRALGTSLVNLTKPTARAAAEIERIGLQAFDAQGNFAGFAGLIGQLETAYANYTPEQRQASLATIFGAEAIQELNILLSAGSEEISAYTAEIAKAGAQQGAFADQVRQTKLDTFDGAIRLLKSAFADLQIEIGSRIVPALVVFVKNLTTAIRSVSEFLQTSKTVEAIGSTFEAIGKAVTPILSAFANVRSAIGEVFSALIDDLGGAIGDTGGVFASLASGAISVFVGALNGVAVVIRLAGSAVSAVIGFFKEYETLTLAIVTAIGAHIVITKALVVAQNAGRIASLSLAAAQAILTGNLGRATVAMKLLGIGTRTTSVIMTIAGTVVKGITAAISLFTGGLKRALVATRALFAVLVANPLIAIAAAVAGIVVALVRWNQETGKVSAAFAGSMAFIRQIFSNFASSFVLIARGLNDIFQGIFELDFDRVTEGVVQLGAGIRLQTVDIAKGASEAFQKAYNERIDEHNKAAIEATQKSVKALGTQVSGEAAKAGEKVAASFGNAFISNVTSQVAQGSGILEALNSRIAASTSAFASLSEQVARVTNTAAGRSLAESIKSQISDSLSQGLISQAQATQLGKDIEQKLVNATKDVGGGIALTIKDLEKQLQSLQSRLDVVGLPDSSIAKIKAQMSEIEDRIADVRLNQIEVQAAVSIDTSLVDSAIKDLERQSLEVNTIFTGSTQEIESSISEVREKLESLKGSPIELRAEGVAEIERQLQGLQELGLNIDPISISVESGDIDKAIQQLQDLPEVAKLSFDTTPIEIQVDSSAIQRASTEINSLQSIDLQTLRLDIEARGIDAIRDQVDSLRMNLSDIQARISIEQGQNVIPLLQQQAESLNSQIGRLNDLRINISSDGVPELKERVEALNAALLRTRPGEGFDQLVDRASEARRELAQLQISQLDAQIPSLDTLNEKLRVLQGLYSSLAPSDPQFTFLLEEISQVETAIQQIENRRILIQAGIQVDPTQVFVETLKVPPIELQGKINIETNIPSVIQPINELNAAAQALGFSTEFANKSFRDIGDVFAIANNQAFNFGKQLGLTSDESAKFAIRVEQLKDQVEGALVNGVANAFQSFGKELGKALATGTSATAAFETLFKGLLSTILSEVPKLIGTFLLQQAVLLGAPAGIPFAIAGIGLVAFSGVASGLLSNLGSGGSQQVATPESTQAAALASSTGTARSTGLASLSASQEQRTFNITNTINIESDGILTELERQIITRNENTFGG